jgi:endoglucanase
MLNRRRFLTTTTALAATAALPAVAAKAAGTPRFTGAARGVNVPGWLERSDRVPPSDAVLDHLSQLGLTTLRLPVDGQTDSDTLRRIDAALKHLGHLDFAAILDMHPGESLGALLRTDPRQAGDVIAAAWQALGGVAAGHSPQHVALELLNEPPMEEDDWLPLRDRLAETVRRRAPRHPIIWGAARYQGIWETVDLPPLDDANSIAAIHFYWPMGFTHQCQDWGDDPTARIGDLPFPARIDDPQVMTIRRALEQAGDAEALQALDTDYAFPWNEGFIIEDFADIAAWSSRTGTPVILNEFGAYGACADPVSRANWIGSVRRAAEAVGIGWTYWELDHGFGLMGDRGEPGSFDISVLEALLV